MSKQVQDAYIVAASRTPIGKAPKGTFKNLRADDLLVHALRNAMAQVPSLDPKTIEDAIVGCAIPEGEQGLNVARLGVLLAGLPNTVGGVTVNRFCASGLTALAMAADRIRVGEADVMIAAGVAGKTVAFQRHGDDSPDAIARLSNAGAEIVEVPVYRWILPSETEPAERLIDAVINRQVNAVTFTSAPAVRNLFLIADDTGRSDAVREALSSEVIAVVVGPVCAGAAIELGIRDPIMPDRFRIGPMVRSLTDALVNSGRRSTISGVPISLQGRVVHLQTEVISLSERESGLLAMLLAAAPKVVSRTELLSSLWGADTDAHVLEVTVARLRRRLPSVAIAIVAVPRRGYAVRP